MVLPLVFLKWFINGEGTLLNPFSVSLLLALLCIFSIVTLQRGWSRKPNLPPSPPKFPIIGNLHQLGPLAHRSFRDLSQRYGPLMFLHLGHVPALIVSSPEIAAEIMKTQDLVFANRALTTAGKAIFYGCTDVAFAPYGEYWRKVRKICVLDLLSIKRVQSFKFVREEEVAIVIEKITHSCSLRETINLSEILLKLSNNVISRCALGGKYENDDTNRFGELTRGVASLLTAFSFGDFFPSLGWMDILTGLVAKLKKISKDLDTFFEQVIDEHLPPKSSNDYQEDKEDFIDLLLHAQKDDPNLTRDNIKAIILDMFVAGSDTAGSTIEWAMAELIKNPGVMKKVQEEIRGAVGKKSKVDEEDIYKMNYLKSIVKENLRLHPPGPILVPRESSKATKLEGYDIPPNTRVFINAWAIHRDPKLWDNPDEFRPERFENNPIDIKGQDFQFIPFGSGRRGCPGISFGLAVVEFVLANLLCWFDWELPGGANMEELDMTEASGLTVSMKNPLHVVPVVHFSNWAM